jgi:hypothetical protein
VVAPGRLDSVTRWRRPQANLAGRQIPTQLNSRRFSAYNFSKNGSQVLGIFHNTSGDGAEWQLYSVNVNSGTEKLLTAVDFARDTDMLAGFSIHPDGKCALTSTARWPFEIWFLEGFERPAKNWFARFLHGLLVRRRVEIGTATCALYDCPNQRTKSHHPEAKVSLDQLRSLVWSSLPACRTQRW